MNLYRYVGNGPTNYTDPSGLCESGIVESAAWGLAAGMATVGYYLTYPTRWLGVDFSSQDRGKAGLWENSGIAGSKTQEVTEFVAMMAATAMWGASVLNAATVAGFTELGAVPIGEGLLAQAELELLVAIGTGSPFAYGQIESANRAAAASQYGAPGGRIGPPTPPSTKARPSVGTDCTSEQSKTSSQGAGTWWDGRYSASASRPNAYWESGRQVFPTLRNSRLSGAALRAEQREFFRRGLEAGKTTGELRGQAHVAGYERKHEISTRRDYLADRGAEKALQDAIADAKEAGLEVW